MTVNVQLPKALADRFIIERPLGQGGFGIVLKASERKLQRVVALKVLSPEHNENPEVRARFKQEARLVSQFRHESIVPLLDYGIEEDLAYVVLPFLEGGSLRTRMAHGPLRWEEAIGHATRIAEALGVIHGAGVIHRDLKPENVLLDEAGQALVTDFGISKPLGQTVQTAAGVILGTPGYLAPEVIQGEPATVRSDLYALGVMLWEMIAGHRPFQVKDPTDPTSARPPLVELAAQIRDEAPVVQGVPGALAELVAGLLARDPAQRPQSAKKVEEALAKCHLGMRPPSDRTGSAQTIVATHGAVPDKRPRVGVVGQRPGVECTAVHDERVAYRPRRLMLAFALAGFILALGVVIGKWSGKNGGRPAPLPPRSSLETARLPVPPTQRSSPSADGIEKMVKELRDDVLRAPLLLRSWRRDKQKLVHDCPLIVLCPRHARITIQGRGASYIEGINGRDIQPASRTVNVPVQLVREGLNWVKIRHQWDRGDLGKVDVTYDRCDCPIRTSRGQLEDVQRLSRIQEARIKTSLQDADSANQMAVACFPSQRDPRWLLVSKWTELLDMQMSSMFMVETDCWLKGQDCYAEWDTQEQLDIARQCLDVAQEEIGKNRDSWMMWHWIGWILGNSAHPESGRAAFARALMICPRAHWSWYELHYLEHHVWIREQCSERLSKEASTAREHRKLALNHRDLALKYLNVAGSLFKQDAGYPAEADKKTRLARVDLERGCLEGRSRSSPQRPSPAALR